MNFALSDLSRIRKEFVFLGLKVVRPGGFELPTFWFVARRSIQLSYGRTVRRLLSTVYPSFFFDFNLEGLCFR